METAAFGAGCFWGVEELFRSTKGVKETAVGYMGGETKNPTYEEVCSNKTGHVETVQLTYDPKEISYADLLELFWKNHNPTTPNRQGPDIGTQYRSVIFYYTPEQERAGRKSKKALEASHAYTDPIVTEIIHAAPFWRAEEYHQKYLQKRGRRVC